MKKITKFLDSVMGGIKRTCVAKALAVFAVASIAINSFAQTPKTTQSVINGVEDFSGLTLEQLKAAATSTNFSFADKSKVLFLYNVNTGKFLNVGGHWGTCASLHDYGKALWVDVNGSNFRFTVDNNNNTGHNLGYVFHATNIHKEETDKGVFIDRGTEYGNVSSIDWTIEPVLGDTKNAVRIYTNVTAATSSDELGTYYLCANPKFDGTNNSCKAYKKEERPTGNYDEWRIFTYQQIYDAQHGSVNNMKNALDLSFRLRCPAFDRNDNDIDEWYTYNFKNPQPLTQKHEDGFAKFGLENYYTTSFSWGNAVSTWSANYTFNNGKKDQKFDNVDDYQRYLGKYFCGSITGKCGMIYQDISITLPGTYVVECKGYSNTPKAKLFAGVLDPKNENKMVDGTMNSTVFNQVSDMSADEQDALQTAEHNMDYAGKALFDNHKYMNSVVLTVPESAFNKDGVRLKSVKIRFGVMTGEYNTDPSKVVAPDAKEWTVFDDFRLQYASTETSQDLILDEMRDNLNYLVNTTNTYKNTTLHLKKTLTKKKWNSLVLPVNLTKDQLRSTFGANTRLAKLKTLTSTSIEFESVNLDKVDPDKALEAYKPYIIFPEKEMDANNTKAYTAILTVDGQTKKVNVPAGHYNIAKVTNVDLSKINPNGDWTTTLVEADDHSIAAYGTFARTFGSYKENENDGTYGTVTTNPNNPIIEGRPTLVDCYFFDKGNMYHSATRPRGLRGFSCWFKPTKNNNNPQSVKLTLDGVTQSGTTGIEDILADYEQPVSRFANGIYNLNGQLVKQGNSTAGLPSGMYIVNGKKCIVR